MITQVHSSQGQPRRLHKILACEKWFSLLLAIRVASPNHPNAACELSKDTDGGKPVTFRSAFLSIQLDSMEGTHVSTHI